MLQSLVAKLHKTVRSCPSKYLQKQFSSSPLKYNFIDCWMCKKPVPLSEDVPLFHCPCKEKIILPPTTENYFKILGFPQAYTINAVKLKQKYIELQKQLHPDKFAVKSQVELEYASQHSALVNKAYATLSLPYDRGIYLLELYGLSISDEEDPVVDDVRFLEDIMNLNECVANSPNDEEITSLKSQVDALLDDNDTALTAHFNEGNYFEAKETLTKMKYYINIKEKLHHIL